MITLGIYFICLFSRFCISEKTRYAAFFMYSGFRFKNLKSYIHVYNVYIDLDNSHGCVFLQFWFLKLKKIICIIISLSYNKSQQKYVYILIYFWCVAEGNWDKDSKLKMRVSAKKTRATKFTSKSKYMIWKIWIFIHIRRFK